MKKWAWLAAISFITVGLFAKDEPDIISATAAMVFLISLVVMFFKWIIGIARKHPEWMADDDDKPEKAVISKKEKTIKTTKSAYKKTIEPISKKYGITAEISPFIAMGKSNGEAIRFDIKPDREIEIEYQDASGDITRRKITAQIIRTAWGGLVIEAYCHLRQSQRSFKLENIRRLYENGHEINVVDWLEQIGFSQNRRVKKRIVKKKISDMVDKMPTSALDEFIKNSN